MKTTKVCDLRSISEEGCHDARIATAVENCKHHERFFFRCVSDQKLPHWVKAKWPSSKIGTDMANLRKSD